MTQVTVSEAATLTGKSRNTINEATTSGKLSATKDDRGVKRIDVSELMRVYPLVISWEEFEEKQSGGGGEEISLDDQPPSMFVEIAELRARVKALTENLQTASSERERERRTLESHIELLRESLERAQKNSDQSLKLLTHEREKGANNQDAESARIAALNEDVRRLSRQHRQLLKEVRKPKTIWTRLFGSREPKQSAG